MRHFRQAGAVATLTRGMGATTRPAGLIALSRRPQRGPPGCLRADRPAIALAAVTTAANQKLQTTLGTMAQAGQRKLHGRLRPGTEGPPGRRPHTRGILSRQPCPARLGRGAGTDLAIRVPAPRPPLRSAAFTPFAGARQLRPLPGGAPGCALRRRQDPRGEPPPPLEGPDIRPLSPRFSPRPAAEVTGARTAVEADSVGITHACPQLAPTHAPVIPTPPREPARNLRTPAAQPPPSFYISILDGVRS